MFGSHVHDVVGAVPRYRHVGHVQRRCVGRTIDGIARQLAELRGAHVGGCQHGLGGVQARPEVVDVPCVGPRIRRRVRDRTRCNGRARGRGGRDGVLASGGRWRSLCWLR